MSRRRRGRTPTGVMALLAGALVVGPPDGLPRAPWRWVAWFPGHEPAVVLAGVCWSLCVVAGCVSLFELLAERRVCDHAKGDDSRWVRVGALRRWVGTLAHRARPTAPTVRTLVAPIGLWAVAGHAADHVAGEELWDATPQSALPAPATAAGDSRGGPVTDEDSDAIVLIRLDFDLAPLPASPTASAESAESWTVETGDHLWAIAVVTLEDRWQRPPADCEIEAYWQRLIAANRADLVDPANPDLILPGQVVALPATS